MKLDFLFVLAAAAVAHASWSVPKDLADGAYRVDVSDDGTHSFTLVQETLTSPNIQAKPREITAREPATRFNRDRRVLEGPEFVTCLDENLPTGDTNNAFNSLLSACNDPTRVGASPLGVFGLSGNIVVYWCNYSNIPICTDQDARTSIQTLLSQTCGSFVGGWTTWVGQSYGQENVLLDLGFCGNGVDG
jgi:hypothetical protein